MGVVLLELGNVACGERNGPGVRGNGQRHVRAEWAASTDRTKPHLG